MWLYHLAPDAALPDIKANGLRSAFSRTNKKEASPNGAFAKNRDKMMATKVKQHVAGYVTILLMNGISRENISSTNPGYTEFTVTFTGNNDDNIPLTAREKEKLDDYKKAVKNPSEDVALNDLKGKNKNKKLKMTDVRDFAPFKSFSGAKALDDSHYLTKLAKQYWRSRYSIEEHITSMHVYFFSENNAENFYKEYSGHLQGASTILRVNKTSLAQPGDVVQDNSDERGFMTPEDVKPGIIQKLKSGKDFTQKAVRENDANWEAL